MSDNNKEEVKVLEHEKALLLDHDYDGIKELDHPLPRWWIIIFILTVVFSIPYYAYYEMMDGPTLMEEYKKDYKEVVAAQEKFEQEQGGFNLDEYNALIADPKTAKRGKKTYKRKCKSCHGADGGGGIGPNLTDKYWLHGNGSIADVYKVIDKGVVDKGMAAWGDALGKKKMAAVVKYVMEFQGTTPANPKEPQGELAQ